MFNISNRKIILSVLFSFLSIQSLNATSVQFNDTLAWWIAKISSCFNSPLQFKLLGDQDVSEETRQLVYELAKKSDIKNYKEIYVKQVNETAKMLFGDAGIFATHNAIFLNDFWFKTLSIDEQQFLIAHELHHIKNNDTLKSLVFGLGFGGAISYIMAQVDGDQRLLFALGAIPSEIIISYIYLRMTEKSADLAAKKLVTAKGGLLLNKRSEIYNQYPYASWQEKIASWFKTHPHPWERNEYLIGG